jgi:IMP dehydrogenase
MVAVDKLHVITADDIHKIPTPFEIKKLMSEKRVEKVPIVNSDRCILGLATLKDIDRLTSRPMANLDKNGQLYVGAAVGANDLSRAKAMVAAGADVLVVDVANGHGKLCIDSVREYKQSFPKVDIVAGSIATGDGAKRLIEAGADGLRCGIGNGSICITRIVAGAGVP